MLQYIKKNCSLPAKMITNLNKSIAGQIWSSVTNIIHLFVLNVFIFEASDEECDVSQFNQLNLNMGVSHYEI